MKSIQFEDYSFFVPGTGHVRISGFLEPLQSLHVGGPSGIGKTTWLRSVAGLVSDQEHGSLKIFDQECVGAESSKRSLSMVFQGFQLFAHLTVEENLLIAFERQDSLRLLSGDLKLERIARILNKLNLSEKSSQLASGLSGGEHQRIAIARALLSEASVVLLDEPFSALDAKSIKLVSDVLQQYQKEHEASFLIVSHRRGDLWASNMKELDWKDGQLCLEF